MPAGPSRRRPRVRWLVPALAAALAAACGLESVPYLRKPLLDAQGSGEVRFRADVDPGDYFVGYVVYYKLYVSELAASQDSNLASRTAIEGAGFRRFTAATAEDPGDPPLISLPLDIRHQPHDVVVRFPFGGEPALVPSWTSTETVLRRGVLDPDSLLEVYKTFSEFQVNDQDLTTEVRGAVRESTTSSVSLHIGLYALSYGKDTGTFQPLYSDPLYLFSMPITVGIQS